MQNILYFKSFYYKRKVSSNQIKAKKHRAKMFYNIQLTSSYCLQSASVSSQNLSAILFQASI